MTDNRCPVLGCDYILVPAITRLDSDVLIVGEYPEEEDIRYGTPFNGDAGVVLRHALSELGVDMHSLNLCNLWQHNKNKNQACYEYGIKMLTREMSGRKVLLMGAEASKFFVGRSVTQTAGLVVTSPLFPASVKFVMTSPSPLICVHAPPGEFLLSLKKFIRKVKETE